MANVTEKRWIKIEEELKFLQKQLSNFSGVKLSQTNEGRSKKFQDIVIEMDPNYKSLAVKFLAAKLGQDTHYSCHVHSTIPPKTRIPQDFWPESDPNQKRLQSKLALTLIWKPVGLDPILKFTNRPLIKGEVNICRYLSRLLNCEFYDTCPHWIDQQLDLLHQLQHNLDKAAVLAKSLSLCKRPKILAGRVTLADICFASIHFRVSQISSAAPNFVPVPQIKA